MADEEKMTLDERWKYLRMRKKRYAEASREGWSRLLTEMEEITGMHRKSLIRRMNGHMTRKRHPFREPGFVYPP